VELIKCRLTTFVHKYQARVKVTVTNISAITGRIRIDVG
jgi:hypothetical protein